MAGSRANESAAWRALGKRRLIDTFPEHELLLDTGLHGRSGDHGRG